MTGPTLTTRLLAAARTVARQEARRVASVTDWGVVAVVSPLTVRRGPDGVPTDVTPVVGLTPDVGDTVGLGRFGARWYATTILKAP